jgi:3',5'-cyclic-AMP phosphodiesterase
MNELDAPVIVVVPGDLHLTKPDLDNARAAYRVVDEVNRLIRPDFVQFIGDNVQDATEDQFGLFNDIRNRLEVPHFSLVGDHDVKGDPDAFGFRTHVGEPYGATSVRGFRFIRLNTQEFRPLGLSPGQTTWFAREVDGALSGGERVVVFQHNYPFQIWENFAGPGIDGWREVVQTRRVEAVICGHTHYGQVANDGRNVMIATRSIGDPEGGPPGYTLLYFKGDDFAMTFRSVEDHGPVVMVTHPRERLLSTGPSHVIRGHDRVNVRAWHEQALGAVRYRIDEQAWSELEPSGDGHWSGPLAGEHLSKGEHVLEVVAIGQDFAEGFQRVGFMVDSTGRYTSVPEVRPAVTSTAFC